MADEEIKKENETVNPEQENETANPEANTEQSPEQKIAELNDKYLRLYAEFDNFRKRSMRERVEYLKSAGEDVFKDILPVVDDFERGIKAAENGADAKSVQEGVLLIYNKLQNILKQKGVEVMDSKGKDFDAETMEAITNIPAPTPDLKGKVVDEIEKGYLLNGKVIRYAKVIVGS
ncbi:MAG TPA: nucleotide exchange factor GrpE [Bacteroidia bacterium]|nr:nucleotide exchange factor GrpE [Bacteroidia bacterium]